MSSLGHGILTQPFPSCVPSFASLGARPYRVQLNLLSVRSQVGLVLLMRVTV